MIVSGCSLVLARKFSPRRFLADVQLYKCTVVQYIGELCRYLVNYMRENPTKFKHSIRVAGGNGMRPEVWDEFQDGLNIQTVVEFYGATEGNGVLMNICHKKERHARGAIGRAGTIASFIMGEKIVRFNVETEEVERGPDGFCIECKPGEPGELIMPILSHRPSSQFVGYTDAESTKKKVLHNAFVKGDQYFRTGDLISKSNHQYFFIDRIGDTFRWKGENVSTLEVSTIVSTAPGVLEANVYGVQVPLHDGRACMVAITATEGFTLEGLAKTCEELPTYARPMFVRVLEGEGDQTATLKQVKGRMREEGCDPSRIPEKLYCFEPELKIYIPFTQELYATSRNRSPSSNLMFLSYI